MSLADPFGPGQPSRTSIVVAALRAFGAREPDPSVRNPDQLAERLITPAELQLIAAHPVAHALQNSYEEGRRSPEVSGMANLLLIRTRFIDDHLKSAIENGVGQVVILGAGLDTRAYRFAELLRDKIVFEVDYQSTQQLKRRRLEEAFGALPPHLRFVTIDFKREQLFDVLEPAGYQSQTATFFIWEGVSMYLAEQSVRETLRAIASHCGPSSSLAMDFAEASMLELLAKFPHLPQHRYTTAWGEPWIFGVPDKRENEFFQECGLQLREILGFFSPDARRRYLTRSDGSVLGHVRGGAPKTVAETLRLLWTFFTHKSRWYAIAELAIQNQ